MTTKMFDRGFYDQMNGKHWVPKAKASFNDVREYKRGRDARKSLEVRIRKSVSMREFWRHHRGEP